MLQAQDPVSGVLQKAATLDECMSWLDESGYILTFTRSQPLSFVPRRKSKSSFENDPEGEVVGHFVILAKLISFVSVRPCRFLHPLPSPFLHDRHKRLEPIFPALSI